MGSHPINLALRFVLELCALTAVGIWGWRLTDQWYNWVLALLAPILIAIVWGVFAVPGDPSRSGSAPIPTSGIIRLAIELIIFGFASWTLNQMGFTSLAMAFGLITLMHYLFSYDRIVWLITRK